MVTYFVELDAAALTALVAQPPVIDALARSGAAVSMAMLDLDDARAAAIQRLHGAGVAVTAWLVLERADGYWLTADNASLAVERYRRVRDWARAQDVTFAAIGLDVEAPADDSIGLHRDPWSTVWRLFSRRRTRDALSVAAAQYAALVQAIHADGFVVETYVYPFIVDERRAQTTLVQRTLGLVDVRADREVLMLYRTAVPPLFARTFVDAYAPDADAVAVGITGGGVDFLDRVMPSPLLSREHLITDLRRARAHTEHLYIFSLEGCVAAGYLDACADADLDASAAPSRLAPVARAGRRFVQGVLAGEPLWDRLGRC